MKPSCCEPHVDRHPHDEPDHRALDELAAPQTLGGGMRTAMRIMQMDCPTEEALIRKKLDGMAGVSAVEFNLMQRILTVDHAADALAAVVSAIRSLGFTPELPDTAGQLTQASLARHKPVWPLAVAAVAALGAEALTWYGAWPWLSTALALFAVMLSGLGTYKKGFVAIANRNLNINALMSIAVTGALALGQWPEAAMVMVLFSLAELIEARSLDRARHAVEQLMRIAPATVTAQQSDGVWAVTAAAGVTSGMRVRARPGERIGLDGVVVSGASTVDQAPITGESLPIDKTAGDPIYAGTINGLGALEYRVTAAFEDTMLARIIHAVEQAQGTRAPAQRFVDRFARIYTPIVCLLALAVALLPPLFFQGDWFGWIYKALVLLVIACPCALVISTPVAIVSGLAAAARQGILIKGGVYLEEGRKLLWLALDKTGTVTHGKPVLTDFVVLENGNADADADGATADAYRRLAASLADRSDHPVSRAIAASYCAQAASPTLALVSDFQALPGLGVEGVIDGTRYALGSRRLLAEDDPVAPALRARIDEFERLGKTVVMLMARGRVLALCAVADTIKPSSRQAIEQLHQLGIRTLMLSGDNTPTARAIGRLAGIDEVRGDQSPEDKRLAIDHYAAKGPIGMVGDGINDAPALARADIGFAMGVIGTDVAIETADVALMDDDLRKIPRFIRLSRATHSILVQNIVLALAIKLLFLALTVVGLGTMWMAVFADVGASLLVVGNSLRLLRK